MPYLGLNPFRSGQCLSTVKDFEKSKNNKSVNPFRSGQCLSTPEEWLEFIQDQSQSLSIRAMSFDDAKVSVLSKFRKSQSLSNRAMSFDSVTLQRVLRPMRLNPFRSGQCLSTVTRRLDEKVQKSQSLSIRAMSFDNLADTVAQAQSLSQSLSIRAMSFDA